MGKEERGQKMWLFRVKTFIESRYTVQLQARKQRKPCLAPSTGHFNAAVEVRESGKWFLCTLEKKGQFMRAANRGCSEVCLQAWRGQRSCFTVRGGGLLGAGM